MKLGNSGGKNKGKKYIKITGNEKITIENKLKADVFVAWFSENYQLLKRELTQKQTLDEDILSDTYLRIHDKILYGGLIIENYKAYFHRAYFTNYMQNRINQQKSESQETEIMSYENTLKEEISEINVYEDFVSEKLLYIKSNYPLHVYLLFVLYLKLGTLSTVALFTDLPESRVQRIISNLKKDIQKNQLINE